MQTIDIYECLCDTLCKSTDDRVLVRNLVMTCWQFDHSMNTSEHDVMTVLQDHFGDVSFSRDDKRVFLQGYAYKKQTSGKTRRQLTRQATRALKKEFPRNSTQDTYTEMIQCMCSVLSYSTRDTQTYKKHLILLYKRIKNTSFLDEFVSKYDTQTGKDVFWDMWTKKTKNVQKTKSTEVLESVKETGTEIVQKHDETKMVQEMSSNETKSVENTDIGGKVTRGRNGEVVYETIPGTDRYRWTKYLNVRVIEDTQTGYINATKMCAMYGKTKGGEPKQFVYGSITMKM